MLRDPVSIAMWSMQMDACHQCVTEMHDGSLHECCDAGLPCESFYAKFSSEFTTVALLLRHNEQPFLQLGHKSAWCLLHMVPYAV